MRGTCYADVPLFEGVNCSGCKSPLPPWPHTMARRSMADVTPGRRMPTGRRLTLSSIAAAAREDVRDEPRGDRSAR